MEYIIFIGAIIGVIIIAKVFSYPFKLIIKLLINILIGIVLMTLINIFGQDIGLHIAFNGINALISGVLGIPGVILLAILSFMI